MVVVRADETKRDNTAEHSQCCDAINRVGYDLCVNYNVLAVPIYIYILYSLPIRIHTSTAIIITTITIT